MSARDRLTGLTSARGGTVLVLDLLLSGALCACCGGVLGAEMCAREVPRDGCRCGFCRPLEEPPVVCLACARARLQRLADGAAGAPTDTNTDTREEA